MSLEELKTKLRRYVETKATVWDFSGGVNAQQARVIADALQADATVVELKLRGLLFSFIGNDMGPEGAKAVAEALRHNATLHTVDLSSNDMGPEGAKAVAEALRHNATLHTVNLSRNNMGPEGAKAVAEALRHNATLHTVNLTWNYMGPEGAKAVAEALRHNATLHTVDLSWNRMGPEGAKAVAEALRYNTTLHTVDLSSNLIDDTIRKDIEELLERNRRLAEHSNDKSQKPAADSNQVLLEAAQAGLLDAVQYAVEAGASLDATTAEGQTALQLAAQHGHTAVVHFLAAQGPEGTPQLAATFWQEVAAGHADLVEYLLGAGGFDVDQTTAGGATPLGVAARHGHAAVVRLLLQAAANVDQADNSGCTPLASACAEGHLEVATRLLSAQAQVDATDNAGRTPLYVACQNGHLKLVPLLLYARATIDHAAKDGSTPESIASKNGHPEVTMLLATAHSSTLLSGPAPPPTAAPTAPAPERKRNRWGDGLEAPAAGARVFFPTGWVPQRDVAQAIQVFGHDVKQLDYILSRGKQIASELQQIGILLIDMEHAAAVFAYTQEDPVTQLYTRCNEACRKAGAVAEKRIELFRDYLYHLNRALSILPAFVGTTYRGVRTLMPPDSYALGKTVTWQAFSSTTQAASCTVPYLVQNGRQLQGSLFVLHIRTGRDIADFSAFPEEQEVLLGLNSVFQVTGHCRTLEEKLAAVPDLGGYDLTLLDVYLLKEF